MTGDLSVIFPLYLLAGGAFTSYLSARVFRVNNKFFASLASICLLAAGGAFIWQLNQSQSSDRLHIYGVLQQGGSAFLARPHSIFIMIIAVFIALLITLFSADYLSKVKRFQLYYPLILLTLSGLYGMFSSADLFLLFLLTELTTITASALIAFYFYKEDAVNAGFKYLIMSSIATMFMLLGIYFVFRSTGSLSLAEPLLSPDSSTRIGAACFLLGFSLKAGVVPLHTWVPLVYSKAPSAIGALLAGVISKSMLFILVDVSLKLGLAPDEVGAFLMTLSLINMLLGSIKALTQHHLKRFLAYSSISQTGYLMYILGVSLYYQVDGGITAALFLFVVIAVMKSLAFLCVGLYEHHGTSASITQLYGINKKLPLNAFSFSVSLAGLAGIPLLAGFNGKFLVFSAAVRTQDPFALFCLAIFLLSTLIGIGGYLPMLVRQYQVTPPSLLPAAVHSQKGGHWMVVPILILTCIVIMIGFYPNPLIGFLNSIASWMGS